MTATAAIERSLWPPEVAEVADDAYLGYPYGERGIVRDVAWKGGKNLHLRFDADGRSTWLKVKIKDVDAIAAVERWAAARGGYGRIDPPGDDDSFSFIDELARRGVKWAVEVRRS